MTVTMTLESPYPPLSAALWVTSLAVYARGACHLAAWAVTRRMQGLGRVYGWYSLASGLVSATAFSVGWWQAGLFFGVMGPVLGVLWQRERNYRNRPATVKEYR